MEKEVQRRSWLRQERGCLILGRWSEDGRVPTCVGRGDATASGSRELGCQLSLPGSKGLTLTYIKSEAYERPKGSSRIGRKKLQAARQTWQLQGWEKEKKPDWASDSCMSDHLGQPNGELRAKTAHRGPLNW